MSDNIIKLIVESREFKFWSSIQITRNIDTFDTFSFVAPFGENASIKDVIKPLQFKAGQLFIDDELLNTITMVHVIPTVDNESNSIDVSGYSKPGILNDCSVKHSDYPIEFNEQTLEQIAKTLSGFYGIDVEFSEQNKVVFERVKLEAGQAPYNFLIKLAKERGFLISNTTSGKLQFWKLNQNSRVTTLKEGHTPLLSVTPNINPQKYYSEITVLSPGRLGIDIEYEEVTLNNPLLNITRPLVYKLNQQLSGADLQNAVKWKMGGMFTDSIKYSISVQGLMDDHGEIWEPNTFINLTAPKAYINNETKFIIQNLTLAKSEAETTIMNLVLPESFTGEIPDRLPWD